MFCEMRKSLFFDNMVSFPFHEWMSDEDFKYLVTSVKSSLNELRGTKDK